MKNGSYTLVIPPDDYPGMRYRGRYAYEHWVEFWKREGRLPLPGHLIHHKNEIKTDNSCDNLEKKSREEHSSDHSSSKPIKHGTLTGYRRKCRCPLCRESQKDTMRSYRERLRLRLSALN